MDRPILRAVVPMTEWEEIKAAWEDVKAAIVHLARSIWNVWYLFLIVFAAGVLLGRWSATW